MTPFTITIEITEATQCHHAVSQLLRVFPKLSLTITVQDETIPTPSGPPEACYPLNRCGHCRECIALRRAIDAIRNIGYAYRRAGACSCGVGANSNAIGNGIEADKRPEAAALARAEADAVLSQNIIDCKAAAAERLEAAADARIKAEGDRGNNHPDADTDDSAYQ